MNGASISPRVLSPALSRRVALARRHFSTTRFLQATLKPRATTVPPPTALSALLSRLSLPSNASLHPILLACLTHPSYVAEPEGGRQELELVSEGESSTSSTEVDSGENNEVLSALGNSLLGLFASEHLSTLYPLLPTAALQATVTAYVGPAACASVARELGVSVQGGGNSNLPGQGSGSQSAGVPVRWSRTNAIEKYWEERKGKLQREEPETVPVARRFQKFVKSNQEGEEVEISGVTDRRPKRETFENVIADTVKAFVGLIYQEQGIHSARAFVHAHFFSRALDMATLITPKNPMHILVSVVSKHLSDAGVPVSSNQGLIERRLLASTGVASQSPLFLVGLFLPSGIKLAEGHGSSKAMAEHRAATNALQSLFLVRGDQLRGKLTAEAGSGAGSGAAAVTDNFGAGLPTSAHAERLLRGPNVVRSDNEVDYVALDSAGKDVLAGSGRRRKV